MTSYLRALRLINFRNYADDTVLLGPGLNVVVGDNAQGKTNLLEAISFAVAGSSTRTANDAEVVRWKQDFARVEARVSFDESEDERKVAVGYAPGQKKRLTVDEAPVPSLAHYAAGGAGVRAVTFFPDDIRITRARPPTAGSFWTACSPRCGLRTRGRSPSTPRPCSSATSCCDGSGTASPQRGRSGLGTGRWSSSGRRCSGAAGPRSGPSSTTSKAL